MQCSGEPGKCMVGNLPSAHMIWGVNKDLEKRSSWNTWAGPKSNDKCPCTEEDTDRAGGHVKTEAEIEIM